MSSLVNVVCQATLDKSVLITSSNLTLMRVKLLLIIRTFLSKVALQTNYFGLTILVLQIGFIII